MVVGLSAELEVVALVVDAVAAPTVDQDRVFGPVMEAELEEPRIGLHGLVGARVQVEERR